MKNLKRLIALVAVFAMALTTIASAATFPDVAEDSAYYEAVETLTKIGIIDGLPDGTFAPERAVTRAEMAKLIATMRGYGASAEGLSTTQFSDVPSTHWASGYIANATGIAINGRPDGTYGPEDNVKYEEAVKMIMATLGYTVIANASGGYPMGYVSAAIREGVTNNVSNASVGTDANRGTIAQLIYNAIDTPLVEQTTFEKDGSGEYTKFDGTRDNAYRTLMSDYLDIVKMKGVIAGNSYVAMTGGLQPVSIDKEEAPKVEAYLTNGYKVKDNEFFDADGDPIYDSVNYTYSFLVGDTDAESYVGKAVILFAMEDDYGDWEIISIAEDPTYNKSITFSLADYDPEDSSADRLYYYKNSTTATTRISLEEDYAIIYNNCFYDADEAYELIETLYDGNYGGEVVAYDTNKTSGYDLIVVEAAISAVVDEIDRGTIELKEDVDGPLGVNIDEIDMEDDEMIVKLTKGGEEITIDDVAEGDVLSIVAYSDIYWVVDVMTNVVEGTVGAKKNSSTSYDGKAYRIGTTYYDIAAGANVSFDAGDTGVFYIDKYGKIAYYDETDSSISGTFGYVVASAHTDGIWNDKVYEIQLLTKDGIMTYELSDKFTLDGTSYDTDSYDTDEEASVLTNALDDLNDTVVEYSLSGNTVKTVRTTAYYASRDKEKFEIASSQYDNDKFVDEEYDAEDFDIDKITLDEDTIVFYVNGLKTGGEYNTIKNTSYVGTKDALQNGDELTGKAYSAKASEDANILILYDAAIAVSPSSSLAVIVEVIDSENANGEDIYELTLMYEGKEVTYATDPDVVDTELTPGDVIKIKIGGSDIITSAEIVYNFDEDVRTLGTELDLAAAFEYENKSKEYFVSGYATSWQKNTRTVTLAGGNPYDGDNLGEYELRDADNVYVIDAYGRYLSIEKGSAGDYDYNEDLLDGNDLIDNVITTGSSRELKASDVIDYVIVRVYDGDVVEAVIIKGLEDYKIQK